MNNMMDLIDRNLIGDMVDSNGNVHYEDIMGIPSEVIHCKDCVFADQNEWLLKKEAIQDGVIFCTKNKHFLYDVDFCSRGIKMEG